MEYTHIPILVSEIIDGLQIKSLENNCKIIDCTAGLGGHSKSILEVNPKIELFCIDQDLEALSISKLNLQKYKQVKFFHTNFINFESTLKENELVDGFLLDLGVSSLHFDNPNRGFSYRHNGPLDMRMNQNDADQNTAFEIINNFSKEKLANIFQKFGEEKFASGIAKKIVFYRETSLIEDTSTLDKIIKEAIPKKKLFLQKNPSKKVFQALRIYINNELFILEATLKLLIKHLKPGGRIAVITFHSLEDRIVKKFFQEICKTEEPFGKFTKENQKIFSKYQLVNKKPILPSEEEKKNNPRSKSAKLRIIQKVKF